MYAIIGTHHERRRLHRTEWLRHVTRVTIKIVHLASRRAFENGTRS